MRRPSRRAQPHVVTAVYNTQGTDQDGGRRVASSVRANLPCFVQPGKAQTVITTDDQEGLRRVTEVVPTVVYFVDDAGLSVNDQVVWVDAAGGSHTYLVLGYYPPCGTSVFWRASCSESS